MECAWEYRCLRCPIGWCRSAVPGRLRRAQTHKTRIEREPTREYSRVPLERRSGVRLLLCLLPNALIRRAAVAPLRNRDYSRVPPLSTPSSGWFVSAQNPLIGALLPHRAAIVADCEMKLVELQFLDVPVR